MTVLAAGTQFAATRPMRGVCGAIFLGFTVVGFAGVFSAHDPARSAAPNANTAEREPPPVQPPTNPSSITVRTDLVQADVLRPAADVTMIPSVRRQTGRHTRLQPPRSRLARVIFGGGQFRPQPFPTPAKN